MQVYVKCSCQEKLFQDISKFIGQEIKVIVDKNRCDTTLIDNGIEVETIPAIILYIIKLNKVYCSQCDQYVQYVNQLYTKLSFLHQLIEEPKNSQPKLFQYACDQLFDFLKCMNANILVDKTYLASDRKTIIDIYMNFYLQNTFKVLVTEQKSKEFPRVCRYMKTINNGEIQFAQEELKLNRK